MATDIKRVIVTPKMAAEILGNNTHNRKLEMRRANLYASDMLKGVWEEVTNDAIVIADTGELLNGQHRLQAVIISGKSIEFTIIRNAPKEASAFMDCGRPRTLANNFSIMKDKYAADKGAVMHYLWRISRIGKGTQKVTWSQRLQLDFTLSAASQCIEVGIKRPAFKKHGLLGAATLVALMEDREKALKFYEQVVTGELLSSKDAAYIFREWFTNQKRVDMYEMTCLYCYYFNVYASGKKTVNYKGDAAAEIVKRYSQKLYERIERRFPEDSEKEAA